jgi:predicted DNA-binding helix-hairpin-helix protein
VPGFGTKTVNALISARRHRKVRLEDLARLGVSLKKVRSFIVAEGWSPHQSLDRSDLRAAFAPPPEQLQLF